MWKRNQNSNLFHLLLLEILRARAEIEKQDFRGHSLFSQNPADHKACLKLSPTSLGPKIELEGNNMKGSALFSYEKIEVVEIDDANDA